MKAQDVEYIVTHCSDTKWDHDVDADDIRDWHIAKGWSDIGYHFVIRLDGTIETGRSLATEGAHARGYNDRSVGVCLVGGKGLDGLPSSDYNMLQMESWTKLCETLEKIFPKALMVGHNDLTDVKTCPNFDVKEYWRLFGK